MGGNLVIYPMKTCVLVIYHSSYAEYGIRENPVIQVIPKSFAVAWYTSYKHTRLSESLALLWIWLSIITISHICPSFTYILFIPY